MKRKFTLASQYTVGVIIFTLLSCSESGDPTSTLPADELAPVISFTTSHDLSEALFGKVTISVDVTDPDGISSLEVFIDGISLLTAANANLVANWDTNQVSEGKHIVKIVALDANGDEGVEEFEVEVKNVLYRFTISSRFLNSFTTSWIYVSDSNGDLVEIKKVSNGSILEFRLPENHVLGAGYSFTRFENRNSSSFKNLNLFTYTDVKPGDFILDILGSRGSKSTHSLSITGTDDTEIESTGGVGDNVLFSEFMFDAASSTLKIESKMENADPSDVLYYIYRNNGSAPSYTYVRDAVGGGEDEIALNDMSTMLSTTVSLPGAESSSYSISFASVANDLSSLFSLTGPTTVDPEQLILYYPDISFPPYSTAVNYTIGNERYNSVIVGSSTLGELIKLEVTVSEFSSKNGVVKVNSSGKFDYMTADAIKESAGSGTYRFAMIINLPAKDTNEVVIPKIPTQLLTENPQLQNHVFEFNRLSFFDYSSLDNYEDFITARYVENGEPLGNAASHSSKTINQIATN